MARELDPQIQPILAMLEDTPTLPELGPDGAREQFNKLAEMKTGEPVHDVFDHRIEGPTGDLDVRVYRVSDEPRPALVYLHGGGFVVGNLDTHDATCRALANAAGRTVISVDYRLAPEHPFPAAVEDSYAAVEWVANNPEAVGGDGTLAIGGDSAGANLSAAVSLMARDFDGPDLDHQLLVYPVVSSPFHEFDSVEENAEGYFLERETMEWFHEQYIQSNVHARNEYLAPLLVDDLSGVPPATVITAGFDPLRDEGNEYARRLEADGVDVVHREYESMVHGFVGFVGMVDAADDALALAGAALSGDV